MVDAGRARRSDEARGARSSPGSRRNARRRRRRSDARCGDGSGTRVGTRAGTGMDFTIAEAGAGARATARDPTGCARVATSTGSKTSVDAIPPRDGPEAGNEAERGRDDVDVVVLFHLFRASFPHSLRRPRPSTAPSQKSSSIKRAAARAFISVRSRRSSVSAHERGRRGDPREDQERDEPDDDAVRPRRGVRVIPLAVVVRRRLSRTRAAPRLFGHASTSRTNTARSTARMACAETSPTL